MPSRSTGLGNGSRRRQEPLRLPEGGDPLQALLALTRGARGVLTPLIARTPLTISTPGLTARLAAPELFRLAVRRTRGDSTDAARAPARGHTTGGRAQATEGAALFTRCFNGAPAVKRTTRRAAIAAASPVLGLRPTRARFART
jgi:hypothetical protein